MNSKENIVNKLMKIKKEIEKDAKIYFNNSNFPEFLNFENIKLIEESYQSVLKFFYTISDIIYRNEIFNESWINNIKIFLMKKNFKNYVEYYYWINNFNSIFLKLNNLKDSIKILLFSWNLSIDFNNKSIYTLQCNNLCNSYLLINDLLKANHIIKKGYDNFQIIKDESIKNKNLKEIKIYLFNILNNYRTEKLLKFKDNNLLNFKKEAINIYETFFKYDKIINNYINKIFEIQDSVNINNSLEKKSNKKKNLYLHLKEKIKKKKKNFSIKLKKTFFSPKIQMKNSNKLKDGLDNSVITNATFKNLKKNIKNNIINKIDNKVEKIKNLENKIEDKINNTKRFFIKNRLKNKKKKNDFKIIKNKIDYIIKYENKLFKSLEFNNNQLKNIENNIYDIKNKINNYNEDKNNLNSPITLNNNNLNFDKELKLTNRYSLNTKNENRLNINSMNHDLSGSNDNSQFKKKKSIFNGMKKASFKFIESNRSINISINIFDKLIDNFKLNKLKYSSYLYYNDNFYNFDVNFNKENNKELNINFDVNNENNYSSSIMINEKKLKELLKIINFKIYLPYEINLNFQNNIVTSLIYYIKNSIYISEEIGWAYSPNSIISVILFNFKNKFYIYWFFHLNSNYFRIILYKYNKNTKEKDEYFFIDIELTINDIIKYFDFYKKEEEENNFEIFVLKNKFKNNFKIFIKKVITSIFEYFENNNLNIVDSLKNNYYYIKVISWEKYEYVLIKFENLKIISYNFFKSLNEENKEINLTLKYEIEKDNFDYNFGFKFDSLLNEEKQILISLLKKNIKIKYIESEEMFKQIPNFLLNNYNQIILYNFQTYYYFKYFIKMYYLFPIIIEFKGLNGYYFFIKINFIFLNKNKPFLIIINQRLNDINYDIKKLKTEKFKTKISNNTIKDYEFLMNVGIKKFIDNFFLINFKNLELDIKFLNQKKCQNILIIEDWKIELN